MDSSCSEAILQLILKKGKGRIGQRTMKIQPLRKVCGAHRFLGLAHWKIHDLLVYKFVLLRTPMLGFVPGCAALPQPEFPNLLLAKKLHLQGMSQFQ